MMIQNENRIEMLKEQEYKVSSPDTDNLLSIN